MSNLLENSLIQINDYLHWICSDLDRRSLLQNQILRCMRIKIFILQRIKPELLPIGNQNTLF